MGTHAILLGSSGSMGREIARLASTHNVDIALECDREHPLPEARPVGQYDVAIDFTLPDAVVGNVERLIEWGIPVVVGTTGWYDEIDVVRDIVESSDGRLIWASNFSPGVQTFFRIVRRAAELANGLDAYDIALHEDHHVRKADSPSGTALSIADIVIGEVERKREPFVETAHARMEPDQLHVSSRRVGHTVGTHSLAIDSEFDTIELTHRAKSRAGFASGALMAARWLLDAEAGFYRYDDVFEDLIESD